MSAPAYFVPRTTGADWSRSARACLTHTGWLPPCPVNAWFQACHDGQRLYLRLEAEEPSVRATFTGPLDPVSQDSCLEFFIAPEPGERYFNFEFNPLGTMLLGFGVQRPMRFLQVPKDPAQFQIEPFVTPGGWGITFTVPANFLRLYFPAFRFSGEAAVNLYKCGENAPTPHYLAWAPLSSDLPDFHRRQDFGRFIFE